MKKISVIVKDKTTLELAEDACKGDFIDLNEVVQVDTEILERLIDSNRDTVYQKKLKEALDLQDAKNQNKLDELNAQIRALNASNEQALIIKEKEVVAKYLGRLNELTSKVEKLELEKANALKEANANKQIELANQKSADQGRYNELSQKYEALVAKYEADIAKVKAESQNEWSKKVSALETEKVTIKTQNESSIKELNATHELDKTKALQEQKDAYEAKLLEKENQINQLQRAKASLNVKQTGEDLESWCDNEVSSYMENGFSNCKWIKDNKVVKEDGEDKGSKADYIFRIYESDKFVKELASICMDMKDENPDSKNKKPNSHYYSQLDKNREKKQCKYALLVSNLELDKPNDLPIYRVKEYKDMYVVRPAYLMTFLNMITSLTQKYADIIKANEKEVIELQEKQALIDEFDKIKNTYLDKPLKVLADDIADILKKSKTIKDASKAIDDTCEDITRRYLKEIEAKIEKFDVAINRLSKKL